MNESISESYINPITTVTGSNYTMENNSMFCKVVRYNQLTTFVKYVLGSAYFSVSLKKALCSSKL